MKKGLYQNLIQLGAVLVLLLVWLIAWVAVGNELVLPSLSSCLKKMGELFLLGWFWKALLYTLGRVLTAFIISFVLAAVFAVVAYLLPAFGIFLRPITASMRALPTLAVLLILLVWAGADGAPVSVAFLSLFPMLYTEIYSALLAVDKDLAEMSEVYRVPTKIRLTKLYLPVAFPAIVRGGASALGFALKLVASAEVLAGSFVSLGGMMQEAKTYLDIPLLFALVLVTFVLSLALDILVNALYREDVCE